VPKGSIQKLHLENAMIGIQYKQNFNIVDEKSARVNLTIQECGESGELDGTCVELVIEGIRDDKTDAQGNVIEDTVKYFPEKMRLRLKTASLEDYMANISNYSFLTTVIIIFAFFSMLNVIKQVAENHSLAQSISPISIGLSLIWNFFFFAVNFQFSIQGEGEFMQYLGLPAFWYFISSFTFESRLFILCWRAQLDQRQMFDEQYLRKRLTWFYIVFYVSCFTAVIF